MRKKICCVCYFYSEVNDSYNNYYFNYHAETLRCLVKYENINDTNVIIGFCLNY